MTDNAPELRRRLRDKAAALASRYQRLDFSFQFRDVSAESRPIAAFLSMGQPLGRAKAAESRSAARNEIEFRRSCLAASTVSRRWRKFERWTVQRAEMRKSGSRSRMDCDPRASDFERAGNSADRVVNLPAGPSSEMITSSTYFTRDAACLPSSNPELSSVIRIWRSRSRSMRLHKVGVHQRLRRPTTPPIARAGVRCSPTAA